MLCAPSLHSGQSGLSSASMLWSYSLNTGLFEPERSQASPGIPRQGVPFIVDVWWSDVDERMYWVLFKVFADDCRVQFPFVLTPLFLLLSLVRAAVYYSNV